MVTFRLRVSVLTEIGYGKKAVSGTVRQKTVETKNNGRQKTEDMIRKEKHRIQRQEVNPFNNNNNNNNNNNRIQRRRELSLTLKLNQVARAQSRANHVQNTERLPRATRITCHVVGRDRSAIKLNNSLNCIHLSCISLAEPFDEGFH